MYVCESYLLSLATLEMYPVDLHITMDPHSLCSKPSVIFRGALNRNLAIRFAYLKLSLMSSQSQTIQIGEGPLIAYIGSQKLMEFKHSIAGYICYDDGCHLRKFARNPCRSQVSAVSRQITEKETRCT